MSSKERSGTYCTLLMRTLSLSAATVLLLYFAAGACLLRFGLTPLVLPHIASSGPADPPVFLRVRGDNGDAMVVRRYGTPRIGCVVFFPGQHGILSMYKEDLFPAFANNGIAVLAVAYPGQNGAPGTRHDLQEILALAERVVASAEVTCTGHRVVVYGRSLGSMVAAYAARSSHPAGLILESAAPTFSSAIRVRSRSRWYLAPLALLPISELLPHDYSLAEALSGTPNALFQGMSDTETPLSALRAAGLPRSLQLIEVSGGTHSTTYILARDRIIEMARSMLGYARQA